MLRVAFFGAALFLVSMLSTPPAIAAGDLAIARPPALLSPDLTEPWIV